MTRLVLLKVGATFDSLRARRGDYDRWFRESLALGDALDIVRVIDGERLPDIDTCAGVIVSGSPAMVTDRAPWSVAAERWLADAIDRIPILGVCYGHQLLGAAAGGRVGDNPRGRQIGTVVVSLLDEARSDPLFSGLPEPLVVQASHKQSVLELPASAVLLATSSRDPHHAFRVGQRTWGVQFHPEFDSDISRAYVEERRASICAEGDDPEALLRDVRESDHGSRILRRFAALCGFG